MTINTAFSHVLVHNSNPHHTYPFPRGPLTSHYHTSCPGLLCILNLSIKSTDITTSTSGHSSPPHSSPPHSNLNQCAYLLHKKTTSPGDERYLALDDGLIRKATAAIQWFCLHQLCSNLRTYMWLVNWNIIIFCSIDVPHLVSLRSIYISSTLNENIAH